MSKFTIFLARNGQFYWHLKASNGETLCHIEETLLLAAGIIEGKKDA